MKSKRISASGARFQPALRATSAVLVLIFLRSSLESLTVTPVETITKIMKKHLPAPLFTVYDFASAAGELEELQAFDSEEGALGYAEELVENYEEHADPGCARVTVSDVLELREWLRAGVAT